MFAAARKSMPAIDYVSIVKSAYNSRRAMLLGTFVCVFGAAACGIKTGAPIFWAIAGGFSLLAVYRFVDMTLFRKVNIAPTDVDAAARWELRATYGGAAWAALAGLWCFAAFAVVRDPSTEIIALVATIGNMVGVVARNFGLDRMLTIQLAIVAFFVATGVLLRDDPYHWVLGSFMLPMLISFRFLAADVRSILLSAVHGRVEASRLAEELDTALDTMLHGLCMLNEDGIVTLVNDRVRLNFSGIAGGNWLGRPFQELLLQAVRSDSIPRIAAERIKALVEDAEDGKVLIAGPNRRFYEVTVSSSGQRTVLMFEDITERVMAEERINFMARFDALTGLPNRGYFTDEVKASLAQRRLGKLNDMVELMIIDIDDFKHVNDSMGHQVGDRLLVEAAHRLRTVLGPSSVIARLGGDEFIAFRSGISSLEAAMADANAILGAFTPPFELQGHQLVANVSIGVVTSRNPDDDLDSLMTKADLALYKSKDNGKAQVQNFHDEMDVAYRYRQRLKGELRHAVAQGALSLVYQPVIDLQTRKVVGCEALARWHHPELGTIPPSIFIPIAEEVGLITDISRWVLRTATKECRNWPDEVKVAVNISARDFRSGDITEMVADALHDSGIPPERLEVEVTETAVIEERDVANAILNALARQGIGIALDDFGTGYSSLSYLQALPFTKLKIDRSFVADIASNKRSMKLLANVAQLGRDIGLTVTVEGVETEEQLDLIASQTSVDQIQGYLFGIPLSRRDIGELIARLAATWRETRQSANRVNIG